MSQEKILDRLVKLFALAENNPSAQEAQTALLMAQRIMAEHAISETDVKAREEVNAAQDEIGEEVAWQEDGRERRDTFTALLAGVVGRYFRVTVWQDGASVCFAGYGNHRKVATLVLKFARAAMIQGAADYMVAWKCVNETDARRSRMERQSWMGGFITGLGAGFEGALTANPTWLAHTKLPDEVIRWVEARHKFSTFASGAQTGAGTGRAHGETAGRDFATQHGGGRAQAIRALRANNT